MTDETISALPHVDPLALFDSVAQTETARVEAEEAELAFQIAARRELRESLFTAVDTLLKSRELHLRWIYREEPPRLVVRREGHYGKSGCPRDLGVNIASERRSGESIQFDTSFDKETRKAFFLRVASRGSHDDRFDNWIAAYEYVVREIACGMAENARDKKRQEAAMAAERAERASK